MKTLKLHPDYTPIILMAVSLFILFLTIGSCNDSHLPYDPEITEAENDSFEISEPALHPHCASNPDSLDPGDLWGKDMIAEVMYRIDSIDIANEMVWCEPVWSESPATLCTGNEWRWYGDQDLFKVKCKEDFHPYVEDTCN